MSEKLQTIRQEKCNLIQVVAPHMVAGIELRNDIVFKTAPILKYMRGWTKAQVTDYCGRKGWQYNAVRYR
ncbi:hypothetical protein UFOVP1323_42 [uncultured Caudovirales phage]|uniref:Uncharacterized protein n=1 Tax=uncultured Caudovirales phage TaxID=2100421 RepID=A0A6J5RJH4_9CAUD|nr:hypothetical protein UFOVP1323_42 [uncultured Caudovirales phage]